MIDHPTYTGNVEVLKLKDGTTLIAEVNPTNTDGVICMTFPLHIKAVEGEGFKFLTWLIGSKEDYGFIHLDDIVTTYEPSDIFLHKYIETFLQSRKEIIASTWKDRFGTDLQI